MRSKPGSRCARDGRQKNSAINHDVSYTFVNRVPNLVTYWATPFIYQHSIRNTGALRRRISGRSSGLTLNLGAALRLS